MVESWSCKKQRETGSNPPSRGAAVLRSARYSRIKGTNRTGATVVVAVVPSACFANTMSSCVVWPEHHGGANDDRICKGRLHGQFTFTPAARARCGIGSDPRNMDEPLNARPLGLACEPLGCFHIQGMKCLCSPFEIEANGIHHAISANDRCSNRGFVIEYRRVSIEAWGPQNCRICRAYGLYRSQ